MYSRSWPCERCANRRANRTEKQEEQISTGQTYVPWRLSQIKQLQYECDQEIPFALQIFVASFSLAWDHDGIDHWKEVEYTEEQGKVRILVCIIGTTREPIKCDSWDIIDINTYTCVAEKYIGGRKFVLHAVSKVPRTLPSPVVVCWDLMGVAVSFVIHHWDLCIDVYCRGSWFDVLDLSVFCWTTACNKV